MAVIGSPVQLSDHVYVIYSEYPHCHSANSYLIVGDTLTLIDCGSERAVPRIERNLAQLGLGITNLHQVIATHGDYDHIQGFIGLRERNPRLRLKIHPADSPADGPNASYPHSSDIYNQPFNPVDRAHCDAVQDGDDLVAGDSTLRVHHAPGHTAGSICLHGIFDGIPMLFTGDVFGGAMRSLEHSDLQAWAQAMVDWRTSLARISGLAFDWVLNGHEPARSLPLPRSHFDRRVRHFGAMLNPWFSLAEDEPELPGGAQVVAAGSAPAYA